jgi:hypothetical protein
LKKGSRNGASLFVGALLEEPGGGLFYWGSRRIFKERLWRRASLLMGAPLGNVEGGLFTRALHVEEGSGDGHLSPQWPWGT